MDEVAIYDNERRYIFTNWTSEDFVGTWAGIGTTIKPGESIELPQYKAFHFCKHLVDREISKDGKVAVDSREARSPYENKTIAEITAGMDSPALASIKEKIKEEIEKETKPKKEKEEVKEETTSKEFEDIQEKPKKKKVK